MNRFAKLFETEALGQMLVKIEPVGESDKPEIRTFFQPPERTGLGLCSVAATFSDTDKGWEQCQQAFERIDETITSQLVESALQEIERSLPNCQPLNS